MRVMSSVVLVVGVLVLITGTVSPEEAEICFCREEVTITLEPLGVLFESLYCFENRSAEPCSQSMFYGFPLDSVHLFPDTISVAYGFLDLEYERAEKGIVFTIGMPGKSCASVWVSYKQACLAPVYCYTPKTIPGWNEPIEEADFEIRVPKGILLESISYEMHRTAEEEDFTIHRFACKNCLPSEDLCVRWLAQP